MIARTRCYAFLMVAAFAALAIAQTASAVEKLTLDPAEFCVTDPANQVEIDIWLEDIAAANPVQAVNFNLEWDPNCCWQAIDIAPAEGWDQFGTELTEPGHIFYSVHVSDVMSPATGPTSKLATVTFQATVPEDGCCVETIQLSLGEIVPGDPPQDLRTRVLHNNQSEEFNPVLGVGKEIRIDQQAPVIECGPDMTVSTWPGVCYWKPSADEPIIRPTVTDNCEDCPVVVTFVRSDGKTGINNRYDVACDCVVITWTATDCCGNSASCDQVICVEDNEPPVIVPNFSEPVVSVDENCVYIVPDWRDLVTITDNCTPDPNVQQTPAPGTVWERGPHDLVINANDSHGNNAESIFEISVVDVTPPVFTVAPEDIVVPADAGKCSAIVYWNVSAVDNCGPVCLECTPGSGSSFCIDGSPHPVTCVARDEAGNETVHNFTVTVEPKWILDIEIQLKGYVSLAPFDRAVWLELRDCNDPVVLPPKDLCAVVSFARESGVGMGLATVEVPTGICPCDREGAFTCARAKLARYSLWSQTEDVTITPDGRKFVAKWLGDDQLILGDLNDSGWVDTTDWLIWAKQFMGINPIPATPADLCNPNPNPTVFAQQVADISGDGLVTAVDYGHLYINNTLGDDAMCCTRAVTADKAAAGGSGPVTRVSLLQLKAMGDESSAALDLNGDGYIDAADMRLTMRIRK